MTTPRPSGAVTLLFANRGEFAAKGCAGVAVREERSKR